MKSIAPGIEQWSWFSEEKQMDFNGLVIIANDQCVIVDPPPINNEDRATLLRLAPTNIVLTNRDHVRETEAFRSEFTIPLYAPEADAPQMDITIDMTYADGDVLPGGLVAIHLRDMKSPGESALLLTQDRGYLILGDALIGKPPGELRLLPAEKFADVNKAKESLARLLDYEYEAVLAGDGASVLCGGKDAVRRAVGPFLPY